MEKTDQPVAKKQNTNAPTESQPSQRNSTLYTISHPNTVIHSISRLPVTTPALTTTRLPLTTPALTTTRLPVTTPALTTTRTILNSLKLPTTMAYLNLPLNTKNGHLVPTLASLPRIAPKPVETTTTQQTIKTEAGDDHGDDDGDGGDGGGGDGGGGGGGDVPMYDLNQSHTVRVFPINIGEESQDSSLLFPHTDGSQDMVDK